MILRYLLVVLIKISCIFPYLLGANAYARTESHVLQKRTDLRIFGKYADFLSITNDPIASYKKLNMEDKEWRAILDKEFNTISNVYYSEKGYVVIEDKKDKNFNFEIHFIPNIVGQSILWTCEILDENVFFNMQCIGWKKKTKIRK